MAIFGRSTKRNNGCWDSFYMATKGKSCSLSGCFGTFRQGVTLLLDKIIDKIWYVGKKMLYSF